MSVSLRLLPAAFFAACCVLSAEAEEDLAALWIAELRAAVADVDRAVVGLQGDPAMEGVAALGRSSRRVAGAAGKVRLAVAGGAEIPARDVRWIHAMTACMERNDRLLELGRSHRIDILAAVGRLEACGGAPP